MPRFEPHPERRIEEQDREQHRRRVELDARAAPRERAEHVRTQREPERRRHDYRRVRKQEQRNEARVEALAVLPSVTFIRERRRLVGLAARHRLPAVYPVTEFVADAGGLMVYGPNVPDLNRRAAVYVDKILKGTPPADLPVEQPSKFELLVNLKAASALGLTIPPSVLARADQVIEK